jgi:glycosyltransferase involved in cell wall biosynthesis
MNSNVQTTPFADSRRPASAPRFSIVIPVLNEERMIAGCLEALSKLEYPHSQFEVIVVDNGSTDRTTSIAASFSSLLNLSILQRTNVKISGVRNWGAAAARGDILAFLDADCIVPARWLQEAEVLYASKSRVLLGAHYRIPEPSSWVARSWFRERETTACELASYVPSGNLFISRSHFAVIGGFDETLETNEDYDFCQSARAAGLEILAYPAIAVVHLGTPQTLYDFYRRQRWHGKHVFKVFLRRLPQLHNLRAVSFALYTIVSIMGLLTGLLWAAFNGSMIPPAIACALLVTGPLLLGMWRIWSSRIEWWRLLPLMLLYFTFGMARAACLLDVRNWLDWRSDFQHRTASAGT